MGLILEKANIYELMKETGSILEGHFELSSGVHTNTYFQCAKLMQYSSIAETIGKELSNKFEKDQFDTILSPAVGGIIIGYLIAKNLNKKSIFVERKEGILQLRRGFEIEKGERIVIIEDVITTAKSALETADIATNFGAMIKGYGCIVDRSNDSTGLKINSLFQKSPVIYQPEDCPLCKKGIPIQKPGSKAKVVK
ncbi:MAG: orotate phosphoribosyltransferase [Cyanobacteriota bacterium]